MKFVKPFFFSALLIAALTSLNACGPAMDPIGGVDAGSDDPTQQDGGGAGPTVGDGDFINGDFEQGAGLGWSQSPGTLIFPAANYGAPAYSGSMVARMGPMGDSEEIRLEQRVRLSATASSLSLATWIDSEELCDVPWYDNMSLFVDGQILEENDRLCNYDNTDGWIYNSLDISPWAGQTVTFSFILSTVGGDALASTIYIDKASIQ